MRTFMIACMLAALAYAAPASAQPGSDLMQLVKQFNAASSAALDEYHRTGDYARYKSKIDPLLDEVLPRISGGVSDMLREKSRRAW